MTEENVGIDNGKVKDTGKFAGRNNDEWSRWEIERHKTGRSKSRHDRDRTSQHHGDVQKYANERGLTSGQAVEEGLKKAVYFRQAGGEIASCFDTKSGAILKRFGVELSQPCLLGL